MSIRTILAFAVVAGALTQPAFAQGHGGGHGNGNARGADKHAQAPGRAVAPGLPQAHQDVHGNAAAPRNPVAQEHAHARPEVHNEHAQSTRQNELHPDHPTGRANAALRQQTNPGIGQEVSTGDVIKGKPGRSQFVHQLRLAEVRPSARAYVMSPRPAQNVVGSALAYALARGVPANELVAVPVGNMIALRNRRGVTLLQLDDETARDVGRWQVVPVQTVTKNDAPAFCRSGAGHPVFGRQWCIDKGFGLGSGDNVLWGRAVQPSAIVLQPTPANTTASIATDVLRAVLGNQTFDRLALHALTLGYTDPLVGRWLGEPTGPRTLLVTSGVSPVAEVVNVDRDNRAQNLLVALRPW
jgi:hypothetical protein